MKNAHQFLDFVTELNPDILQSASIQILQEKLTDVKRLTS
ncbi:hypothetical protein EDO6_02628 [Paenibacillus xylanexedens]|nr:hypothetical protein EDO6_02628 [Paenibacillus xylanexedens]